MNILIVGNILKDVYLNLDSRNEPLETDKNGIEWLNLGFNSESHHYFNRASSFGGAAISAEVLHKMGFSTKISTNPDFSLDDNGVTTPIPADTYRYILVAGDEVSYFVPNHEKETTFLAPASKVDYIYIDRSAKLSVSTVTEIVHYTTAHPETKLAVYLKDPKDDILDILSTIAAFTISETELHPIITPDRINKITHLSAYSIAAATIFGGFILGKSREKCFEMARSNLSGSTITSVLTLSELESLHSVPEENIELIAANLVAPGKGILAADESGGSIKKKFAGLNIPDTFGNRHDYRNIFFTTPNIEQYLNGVILFDETARDFADNGQTYIDFLTSHRIIPGVKVDQGLEKFENSEETYTKGLADLPKRLQEYHEMGLRFAKWRAAFNLTVNENGDILTPTKMAIDENCRILAEYAKACQSAGIVPIVEPEVVYDGYYSIEQNATTTGNILDTLFAALVGHQVNLRACILKVNMVLAGKQLEQQSSADEVGQFTADTLKAHVPPELAGIVFLSGGQTTDQATANLAAITRNGPFPWPVTFSFARALQDPALYAWRGDNNNSDEAHTAFKSRLEENCKALNSES